VQHFNIRDGLAIILGSRRSRSTLYGAIELTFFGNALVRLGGASYSILKLVFFSRQQVRDLKYSVRADASNKSGRIVDRLADFESVVTHGVPQQRERPQARESQ
jgi:hypothetical protein